MEHVSASTTLRHNKRIVSLYRRSAGAWYRIKLRNSLGVSTVQPTWKTFRDVPEATVYHLEMALEEGMSKKGVGFSKTVFKRIEGGRELVLLLFEGHWT